MKYELKKPCEGCPFRKNAAKGWLGSYTAEEIIEHALREIPFFCHIDVERQHGYEESDWEEWAFENGQMCAGYLVMMRKMAKLPRDPEFAEAVRNIDAKQEILFPPQVFIDYHSSNNTSKR